MVFEFVTLVQRVRLVDGLLVSADPLTAQEEEPYVNEIYKPFVYSFYMMT